MKKYHILTYGCKMNTHESEKLAGVLEKLGYSKTDEIKLADVIVFNTCTIRANAENKVFGNIGSLKQHKSENKDIIIAVCGCLPQAQNSAEELKQMFPYIDIIFGTHNVGSFEKFLNDRLMNNIKTLEVLQDTSVISEDYDAKRNSFPNAFVNIMYGCNNYCSYCIVPYVRGREKSRDFNKIVNEVEDLIKQGYKEITLLGQNVNSYGNDLINSSVNFASLLEKLGALPYKYRLKFITSHPKDLTKDVVNVIAKYDNLSKYIHLPIQSGSNSVLNDMNRRYTREEYLEKISMIKEILPSAKLSTDLMIGFPNESEKDFEDTMSVVLEVKFLHCYTFVYSRRKGTKADAMNGQIPEEIKTKRITKLVALTNKVSAAVSMEYVGKTYEVLIENIIGVKAYGKTDCGKLINLNSSNLSIGDFVLIKVTKAKEATLLGEVINVCN